MAINLLPWRAMYYQKQQKYTLIIAISALIMTSLIIAIWLTVLLKTEYYQQQKLNALKKTAWQTEQQYAQLHQQLSLHHINNQQQQLLRILSLLPQHLPLEIYLTHINYQSPVLIITGNSRLPDAIARLQQFIATTAQKKVQLIESKHLNNELYFSLQIK
jgi:Tfp pilus assembly protein PilN